MYRTYRDARAKQYRLKLTYFNGRGRCEAIRLLLAAGEHDYDDVRLEGNTAWNELKPKTPFGTLPVLEADGQMLNSSVAIGRLVAKILDIAGDNFLDQALVDGVVDTCIDLRETFIPIMTNLFKQKQGQAQEEECNALLAEMKNKVVKQLENLEKHLGDNSFFVGNKLSFADIQFYASLEMAILTCNQPNFLDDHPKLKALYNRVADIPAISKYLVSRPSTSF